MSAKIKHKNKVWGFIISNHGKKLKLRDHKVTLWSKSPYNKDYGNPDELTLTKSKVKGFDKLIKIEKIIGLYSKYLITIKNKGFYKVVFESSDLNQTLHEKVMIEERKFKIFIEQAEFVFTHVNYKQEITICNEIMDKYDVVRVFPVNKRYRMFELSDKISEEKRIMKKVVNKSNLLKMKDYKSLLENEVKILESCNHDSIIKMISYDITVDASYFIMEFAKGGTLQNLIDESGIIKESDAQMLCKTVVSGIKYLHENHITHLDIKPSNLVLMSPKIFSSVKIIDFDMSVKNDSQILYKTVGTYYFMSPQILKSAFTMLPAYYTRKTDIWSLGASLFYSMTLRYPFYRNRKQMIPYIGRDVDRMKVKLKCKKYKQLSARARHVISCCLQVKEDLRPSAENLITNYEWLS